MESWIDERWKGRNVTGCGRVETSERKELSRAPQSTRGGDWRQGCEWMEGWRDLIAQVGRAEGGNQSEEDEVELVAT